MDNGVENGMKTVQWSYKTDPSVVYFGLSPGTSNITGAVYSTVVKHHWSNDKDEGEMIPFVRKDGMTLLLFGNVYRRSLTVNIDLFVFQELMTGFKVVDDLFVTQPFRLRWASQWLTVISSPQVNITCQFSRGEQKVVFWKGRQWTNKGRVQLWTSTHRPQSKIGTELWSINSTDDSVLGMLPPSPTIPSVTSQSRRTTSSFSQGSAQSTPTTESLEMEKSAVRTLQVQHVQIGGDGNIGAILQLPDAPSLVIFLQDMLLVVKSQ